MTALRAGRPWSVPAEDVRDHLRALRAATHLPCANIADLTGVDERTIWAILSGERVGYVQTVNAEAIFALEPATTTPHRVPVLGTHRRLQALAAAGHSLTGLALARGLSQNLLSAMLRVPQLLLYTSARLAIDVYDEYSTADGDSGRTRAYAARRRWAPPEAWTDETIDAADARPWDGVRVCSRTEVDEIKVERLVQGERFDRVTIAERRAAVALMRERYRLDDLQISARTGWPRESIQRTRALLGLPPISARRAA
jgi:hypothetical protein